MLVCVTCHQTKPVKKGAGSAAAAAVHIDIDSDNDAVPKNGVRHANDEHVCLDNDPSKYRRRFEKLRIKDENVAKVTSDRAYGVAVMPSTSHVVAVVGDKSGNLGIWNYSSQHL